MVFVFSVKKGWGGGDPCGLKKGGGPCLKKGMVLVLKNLMVLVVLKKGVLMVLKKGWSLWS